MTLERVPFFFICLLHDKILRHPPPPSINVGRVNNSSNLCYLYVFNFLKRSLLKPNFNWLTLALSASFAQLNIKHAAKIRRIIICFRNGIVLILSLGSSHLYAFYTNSLIFQISCLSVLKFKEHFLSGFGVCTKYAPSGM